MPWLMKAEPDSRIVKGKDVKFSVDDFERVGVSPWDGVRNHEAKKIMREKMKLGDKVLFYHSNCKVPGVFAVAEISKEGYPDFTAWDPDHPYFDPKSKQDSPTWFMVDVRFKRRLDYPPTLALIKHLATLSNLPKEVSYIGDRGLEAIKNMSLVNRGRLSVQPVDDAAYNAIVELGTKGGWDSFVSVSSQASKSRKAKASESSSEPVKAKDNDTLEEKPHKGKKFLPGEDGIFESGQGQRRSKRLKRSLP
ncbi:hypothetical protein CNBC4040 [Cryptococcus deneoformans B-3501A]|uniref:hypothetical protein n=1 Tax=Cryptococcus deneoformans (strain B-3501A) TaxID=283643 RepID=UPI000042E29D|nr:hypothetical protein CNBC4040 [Cryptococcus neoformans var. neoformans B-3501A]EAL22266.1 hypothetical protein CNBC4040 [Cryptococcus neoformans var. neoformans B-3501A]